MSYSGAQDRVRVSKVSNFIFGCFCLLDISSIVIVNFDFVKKYFAINKRSSKKNLFAITNDVEVMI